ncbi:MAG: hypothetical protein IJM14_03100 [Lachnospiraceae bacterium]|nr:hypothetical protein [Lachnospiraceae bacterium]
MNFVRCSKGHFYDSDRHTSCPKCNVSGVVPANDELTEINPEEDKTEEKAEKIYAALETAEAEVWSEVSEEVKENLEKGKELTKLVGWLVDRTSEESYELRMDMTINPVNEVVIYVKAEQENVLSADTKAADAQLVLSYDEAQKDYMIKNNSASVSLNGRTLDSDSRLASYDRISINGKELVFVPFYR